MNRALITAAAGLVMIVAALGPAMAVGVDRDALKDPALEARAHVIMKSLRCLVCQNQSIEESNADLARDLRHLVRQRVAAGDGDDEVRAFIVARYGDWVLLKPPFKTQTLVLWLGPLLLLGLGGWGVIGFFRHRGGAAVAPEPLTEAERERLAKLLDKAEES